MSETPTPTESNKNVDQTISPIDGAISSEAQITQPDVVITDGKLVEDTPTRKRQYSEEIKNRYADVDDIVKIGKSGYGHVTDSKNLEGKRHNGMFISNANMEQIIENQNLIRDNLPAIEKKETETASNEDSEKSDTELKQFHEQLESKVLDPTAILNLKLSLETVIDNFKNAANDAGNVSTDETLANLKDKTIEGYVENRLDGLNDVRINVVVKLVLRQEVEKMFDLSKAELSELAEAKNNQTVNSEVATELDLGQPEAPSAENTTSSDAETEDTKTTTENTVAETVQTNPELTAKIHLLVDKLNNDPETKDARKAFIAAMVGRNGVEFSHKYSKKRLGELKQEYDSARNSVLRSVTTTLEFLGFSPEQVRAFTLTALIKENNAFTVQKFNRSVEVANSRKLKGFYEWYAKQGGSKFFSKQTLKKSLAVAGLGLGAGVVAGASAALIATGVGPVFGVGFGAAAARTLSKGLLGAKIRKNADRSEFTLRKSYEDKGKRLEKAINVDFSYKSKLGMSVESSDVSSRHMIDTQEIVKTNRKRTLGAVAVSALFGIAGSEAVSHLIGNSSHAHEYVGTKPKPSQPSIITAAPETTHTPVTIPQPEINPNNYEGYEYPWSYFANQYGAAEATPKIEHLAQVAEAAGWKVNPLEDQKGILSMVSPSGEDYSTTPGIIAALESFDH